MLPCFELAPFLRLLGLHTVASASCVSESTAIIVTPGHSNKPLAPPFMLSGSPVVQPLLAVHGPTKPHAHIPPRNTLSPTRVPISIPPPTSVASNRTPQPHRAADVIPSVANNGGRSAHGKHQVNTTVHAANAEALTSVPTCDFARLASANMDFMVSAVAVPDGNRSCDSSRKCRRRGTAKKTPRNATDAPQVIIVQTEYRMPSRCRAGMGPMRPAAMVMEPAALATVWHTFASSWVNGIFGLMALNSPMLTAAAKTLPPWPHPALSPKLTFIADTTKPTSIPAITARGLSGSTASNCGVIFPDA